MINASPAVATEQSVGRLPLWIILFSKMFRQDRVRGIFSTWKGRDLGQLLIKAFFSKICSSIQR